MRPSSRPWRNGRPVKNSLAGCGLRCLCAEGPLAPLSDPQVLSEMQERQVADALDCLQDELAAEPSDPAAQIVLKHLRKYRDHSWHAV